VNAGGEIEIRELTAGIYNAFDAAGTRLAVVVRLSGGWWIGMRIGRPGRHFHLSEGEVETAARILLAE
jgi:hypothetical protein